MKISDTLRERFFAKIRADDSGCVLWCGHLSRTGYGKMKVAKGVVKLAHHVSWFLKYNAWPTSLMHKCDTPACVKISHLKEGSVQENQDDKVAKNRQLRGEDISSAKLIEEDVREIRRLCVESDLTLQEIADRFGITMTHAQGIHARRFWKWLDAEEPKKRKRTIGCKIRELASQAGVAYSTIATRMRAGLSGDALIAPKHRTPRKTYTYRK